MSARLVFDEDLDPAQLSWASIERWCSLLNARCSRLNALFLCGFAALREVMAPCEGGYGED